MTQKVEISKTHVNISFVVAVIFIVSLLTMAYNFTTWKTQMEEEHEAMTTRQDHLSNGHASLRESIKEMERNGDLRDIQMAEIKTKLANIESLLIDLKTDLREHQD